MRFGLVAAALVVAACGDNDSLELDSTFERDRAHFFGTTGMVGPPPDMQRIALGGVEVCLDDYCELSNGAGAFVIGGPLAPQEVLFTARADGLHGIVIPTFAAVHGERNIGNVPLQMHATIADNAAVFGIDPQLDVRGGVLVIAERYDDAPIELAIDGATPHYFDAENLPVADMASLHERAMFFAIEPGEVILRASVGTCEAVRDGWPGAAPGEIRLPIRAGHFTFVRPYCWGN